MDAKTMVVMFKNFNLHDLFLKPQTLKTIAPHRRQRSALLCQTFSRSVQEDWGRLALVTWAIVGGCRPKVCRLYKIGIRTLRVLYGHRIANFKRGLVPQERGK